MCVCSTCNSQRGHSGAGQQHRRDDAAAAQLAGAVPETRAGAGELGGARQAYSVTDDLICGSQALKESEESLQAQLECNDFVGALKLSSESAAVVSIKLSSESAAVVSIKLSSESAAVVGIKLSSESAAVVCLDPHWVVADE